MDVIKRRPTFQVGAQGARRRVRGEHHPERQVTARGGKLGLHEDEGQARQAARRHSPAAIPVGVEIVHDRAQVFGFLSTKTRQWTQRARRLRPRTCKAAQRVVVQARTRPLLLVTRSVIRGLLVTHRPS